MLVLSRHRDQSIMIGDDIEVKVADVRGDIVRLGINAPRSVSVHRREVYEQIKRGHSVSAQPGSTPTQDGSVPAPAARTTAEKVPMSDIQAILNPYGLAFTLGLMPANAPCVNPNPMSLEGFVDLAQSIGTGGVELPTEMVNRLASDSRQRLRERLAALKWTVVMSQALGIDRIEDSIAHATAFGGSIIRTSLTTVLCGDRAAAGQRWETTVREVRRELPRAAAAAREQGLSLAIEDHQDFTSAELMELCELGGDNVGVCLDTANALAVGEDPVQFAQRVAPRVLYVHMKDYFVQWTDEGYRLIRCPVGEGCIPFQEILKVLRRPRMPLLAMEIGALSTRHIRLLTPQWWQGYPPRELLSFVAGLRAARVRRISEEADWRTPWERGEPPENIVAYEMDQLHRSAVNMRRMGLLSG